jgi:probable rRNA maturation factor
MKNLTKKQIKQQVLHDLMLEVQFAQGLSAQLLGELKPILTKAFVKRLALYAIDPNIGALRELTLRVVGHAEGRRINKDFRAKDYATNILTFNDQDEHNTQCDVLLCAPVVIKEAKKLRISLRAHCAHLVIHSCLHAQGYDHELSEAHALQMETLESLLMRSLGYKDPYNL